MRLLLRYLLFIGVPYAIARQIEKRYWKNADNRLKKSLEDSPVLDPLSESSKKTLGRRGGLDPFLTSWFVKVVVTDFAIKVGIAGGVGATIWAQSTDNAAGQVAKYGSTMIAVPGKKFLRLFNRVRGIDPQHSLDIREILLDKEITNLEKVELLKIKIESVLRNLKGSKRRQFILFVIATILFNLGGNLVLFGWFMERLRGLIGVDDDADSVGRYIIEQYREYNAPLPKDLSDILPDEVLKAIDNLK